MKKTKASYKERRYRKMKSTFPKKKKILHWNCHYPFYLSDSHKHEDTGKFDAI